MLSTGSTSGTLGHQCHLPLPNKKLTRGFFISFEKNKLTEKSCEREKKSSSPILLLLACVSAFFSTIRRRCRRIQNTISIPEEAKLILFVRFFMRVLTINFYFIL